MASLISPVNDQLLHVNVGFVSTEVENIDKNYYQVLFIAFYDIS